MLFKSFPAQICVRSQVFQYLASSEEAQEVQIRFNPPSLSSDAIANFMKSVGHDQIAVIDIGARKLDYESHVYEPLRKHGLAGTITGFEPLCERTDLQNFAAERIQIHPLAIGTGSPEKFHINSCEATSSMYPWNVDFIKKFQGLGEFWTKN